MKRSPALLASLILSSAVYGQSSGLDSVTDDAMMQELASRRLTTLLDRAFEVNKTPKEKRDGVMTAVNLAKLSDPALKLTPKDKQELLKNIIGGVEQAMANMNNGKALMDLAMTLDNDAAAPHVATLEYWGNNPKSAAELKQISTVVGKLYGRAKDVINQQVETLSNQIQNPNDPRINQVEQLMGAAQGAEYKQHNNTYNIALSTDDKTYPDRRKLITDTLEYLKQYNNPESNIQPDVQISMAKLNMQLGQYDAAKKIFDELQNYKGDPKLGPKQGHILTAKYFSAQADVLAGKFDVAQKSIADLENWVGSQPGNLKDAANPVIAILKFRNFSGMEAAAKSDADKAKANESAVAVLTQLRKDQPAMGPIIDEQIMARLPENPDVTKLDALLLQAMIGKANSERGVEKADPAVMSRGIAAAREYVARKGKPGIDEKFRDDTAIRLPFFLIKVEKHAEAANAFIDYMDTFGKTNQENGKIAIDQAGYLIGTQRAANQKAGKADPELEKAYQRFLPIAINAPYGRVDLAFEYANFLLRAGKTDDAIKYFNMVPQDDKRFLDSRFFLTLAMQRKLYELDPKTDKAARDKLLAQLQTAQDQVIKGAQALYDKAADDKAKKSAQSMLVRTSLSAADLSMRELKKPDRTIQLLENFENRAKDLGNADALVAEALSLKVRAQMAVNKFNEATDTLFDLLKRRPEQGAQIVFDLLTKLNEEYDRAKKSGGDDIKAFADNRERLASKLVDWAEKESNPNIKKQVYGYKKFAARTKHDSAALETDEAKRNELLKGAIQVLEALKTPENVAAWKATAAPKSGDFDPQVELGLGLIQYDLKNYANAALALGKLRSAGKLGAPDRITPDGITVDNDQYWEAVYKEMNSLKQTGNAEDLANAKKFLGRLFIERGPNTGGRAWREDFEALRKDLISDLDYMKFYKPPTPDTPAPTTQSAQSN